MFKKKIRLLPAVFLALDHLDNPLAFHCLKFLAAGFSSSLYSLKSSTSFSTSFCVHSLLPCSLLPASWWFPWVSPLLASRPVLQTWTRWCPSYRWKYSQLPSSALCWKIVIRFLVAAWVLPGSQSPLQKSSSMKIFKVSRQALHPLLHFTKQVSRNTNKALSRIKCLSCYDFWPSFRPDIGHLTKLNFQTDQGDSHQEKMDFIWQRFISSLLTWF